MLNAMEPKEFSAEHHGWLPGRSRIYSALTTGALFAGGLTYIGLVDPHRSSSIYPQCPFKMLTGLNCPGCGGLRMTHDLLHGDLAAAVVDNVYLLVGIPLFIAWVVYRRRTGRSVAPWAMGVTLVVSALVWLVIRNLPGFPLVPTIYSG